MASFHFVPRLPKLTPFSSNNSETPSLFDQICPKIVDNVITVILCIDITDNCPMFLYFPIGNEKRLNDKTKNTFRDQSPERTSAFMDAKADLDFFDIIAILYIFPSTVQIQK